VKAAEETLGMRTVDINAFKKSAPWLIPEIKKLAHEKRKSLPKTHQQTVHRTTNRI
jgi:hypothetical protein